MFEQLANFFQGKGWVSNAQRDEDEKKRRQPQAVSSAPAPILTVNYRPNTAPSVDKDKTVQMGQLPPLPNIVLQKPKPQQFSPQQIANVQKNPNAPWSPELKNAAMNKQPVPASNPKTDLENYATVSGNIPVWNVVNRLGAWAAEGLGNLTGNKDLADRASNFRSQLDVGMSNSEINALPEEQRNKIRTLQTGVEVISPLDLLGLSGLIKAPIVGGIKQGVKDIAIGGIKNGLTDTTKTLLKQGVQQQGKTGLIGAGIGGVADPAIQAYINNGNVDWGQVPGSMVTGALWGAGIPSQVTAMRNSARSSVGNAINETTGSAEQVGALTLARRRLLQQADQIEESANNTPTSDLGKIDDGISSPVVAEAKRTTAQDTANQLRQQADQIPDEPPVQTAPPQPAPQITNPDITNPPLSLTLQRGSNNAWENQNLIDSLSSQDSALHQAASDAIQNAERGPDGLLTERGKAQAQEAVDAWGRVLEQRKALQQAIDAETVAPTPEAPVPDTAPIDSPLPVNTLDSPITAESRAIADATPPVAPEAIAPPVSETTARLNANADAQGLGTTQPAPTPQPQTAPTPQAPQAPDLSTYSKVYKNARASVPGSNSIRYTTGNPSLDDIVHDALIATKGTSKTVDSSVNSLIRFGLKPDQIAAIRNYAVKNVDKKTGQISNPEKILDIIGNDTPAPPARTTPPVSDTTPPVDATPPADTAGNIPATTLAPDGAKVGTIVENAIKNAGRSLTDAELESLGARFGDIARQEATATGSDIEKVLKAVQDAWDHNLKNPFNKITTVKQAGLTNAENDLYQRIVKEQDFVRNRADFGNGPWGNRGGDINQWYSSRDKIGTEYDPTLRNERSRGGILENLDYSTVPTEHYIRRYGNADKIMSQQVFDAIQNKTITKNGETSIIPSGVKLDYNTKLRVEDKLKQYIAIKDDILTKQGTLKSTRELRQLDKKAEKILNDVIDDVVRNSKGSINEIADMKARLAEMRGAYNQSWVRSSQLSNPINQILNHTSAAITKISDPIVSALNGGLSGLNPKTIMGISKQANGSALRSIGSNFRANMALAGGNPLVRASAGFRGAQTAVTQSSDLTTRVVKNTLTLLAREARKNGEDMSDVNAWVQKKVGSPEFNKLASELDRQIYAGYVGSKPASNLLSKIDNIIYKGLKNINVNDTVARNVNDLFSTFIGVSMNLGAKASNSALLGVPNTIRGLRKMRAADPTQRLVGKAMMNRSLVDGVAAGGIGAYMVGMALANDPNVTWTGEYPSNDPNKQARWAKDGTVENAIEARDASGNVIFRLQPGRMFGPAAMAVVLPLAIKSGEGPVQAARALTSQFVENMGASSIDQRISQVSDLSKLITGSEDEQKLAGDNLLAELGRMTSYVEPLSGLQTSIAAGTDQYKRDTKSPNPFVGSLFNRTLGLHSLLPEKTDSQGNPVRDNRLAGSQVITFGSSGGASGGSSEDGVNSLSSEIDRLARLGYEVFPSKQSTNADDGGTANSMAERLLSDEFYTSLDDEAQAKIMKDLLGGTKTKDLNDELDEDSKLALTKYTLLGENKGNAWKSESIDNFADYSLAKYENEVLNGTIDKSSTENDSQTIGSLRYNALAGQALKQLGTSNDDWNSYQSVNETKFNAMDPSNPIRQKLQALDMQLVNAGFPSKFQNSKGGYGTGSGSKKSSRSGAPSIAFVSGANLAPQESGFKQPTIGKSNWDTPLVKPIGIGEASRKVARKISVKRGASL